MYKRRVLEISVDRVKIGESCRRRGRSEQHLLVARLVWPRPAVAERVSIKPLDFEDNTVDLAGADWSARVLFKETVQGPFGLELSVTEPVSSKQAVDFLRVMTGSVFKMGEDEAEDVVSGFVGRGLITLPFEYISKVITAADRWAPRMLGAGTASIELDASWGPGEPKRVEVPLTVRETIYRTVRTRKHGESATSRRALLKAGQTNGAVTVCARLYG